MDKKVIDYLLKRHKQIKGDSYVEVAGYDDRKKDSRVYSTFFNINQIDNSRIVEEAEIYNAGSFGAFINLNPLKSNRRKKEYIKKILNIFIDVDNAEEEHNKIILTFLEENGFKIFYNALSGGGYHIIVPVLLDIEDEIKVKNFLSYLKNHVSNKVDTHTGDNTRMLRFPGSEHNKKDSFTLKTIYLKEVNEEDILNNSELINHFQYENKKGEIDNSYLANIDLKDQFFSKILNDIDSWAKFIGYLNSSTMRNGSFVKNLAIFVSRNKDYYDSAINFLNNWENSRVPAFKGWIKKAYELNMFVNYRELFKWSKDNGIKEWQECLLKQINETFIDEIEFYYLEDEKPDNCYLVYYPKKNYYVTKNLQGMLETLYFEAQDRGLDLIEEFNIPQKDKKNNDLSHQQRVNLAKAEIRTKLDKEKRIKKVFNINYEPLDEKFIWYQGKKFFNIYNKTIYWDVFIDEEEYHFPHIKELIMNLCGDNVEAYNWFNKWLGWQLKYPNKKISTAVILQGQQGSGKGVLKNLILDNIFGTNIEEINQTHLEGSFNDYLLGKQLIVANEVIHNENKALLPNVLKNYVTDETIRISRKFKNGIEGKNYTHWIFCTNNENPLKIDEDDRRYSVFYSKKLRGSEDKAVGFVKELIANLEYELKQYISYLKTLDIDEIEVRKPIVTQAKKDIIELNRSSFDRFIDYFKIFDNFRDAYISIMNNEHGLKNSNGNDYVINEMFYKFYNRWCNESNEKGIFGKQMFARKLGNYNLNSKVFRAPKSNVLDETRLYRGYNLDELNVLCEDNQIE